MSHESKDSQHIRIQKGAEITVEDDSSNDYIILDEVTLITDLQQG